MHDFVVERSSTEQYQDVVFNVYSENACDMVLPVQNLRSQQMKIQKKTGELSAE